MKRMDPEDAKLAKKGILNPLWSLLFCVGFSCFVFVVLVAVWLLLLQHFFFSLLRFCHLKPASPNDYLLSYL